MANQFQSDENQTSTWKTTSIVLGILLVGALVFGTVFYSKYNDQTHKATDLSTLLDNTRTQLQGELATLNTQYTDQIAVNDTLSADLQAKVAEVEDLKVRIEKAKKELKSSKANAKEIQSRLAQMEELKISLEKDIFGLREENQALAASNKSLNEEAMAAKEEIVSLNKQVMTLTQANEKLTGRLRAVAPAGFRADNFTVMSSNKRDKVTTKSKQIDAVTVSFDLNNIPEEYHGNQNLYLVLTEFNGNPVSTVSGKEAKVKIGDSMVNVKAADAETINIRTRQSVTMSFEPTENLDPGTYNLMVYADNGYLGSTGFLVSK